MSEPMFLTFNEVIKRYRGQISEGTLRNWRSIGRVGGHDLSGPANDAWITPRHPAGSNPCGLCRNRWKHQRNCTASRCLEKYYL